MPINRLYLTWMREICALRPNERITRVRNFVWLIVGIYQSRSVHLSKVAGKIPGLATMVSITRRLSRFLDNPAVRVREWYEPIARQWIQAQWHCLKELRLIVDGTKVGFGHQLLMVSLALSETRYSDCLDVGSTGAWSQQCLQASSLVELRSVAFARRNPRFSGRGLRIWLGGSPDMAGSVALVLCFAPEIG